MLEAGSNFADSVTSTTTANSKALTAIPSKLPKIPKTVSGTAATKPQQRQHFRAAPRELWSDPTIHELTPAAMHKLSSTSKARAAVDAEAVGVKSSTLKKQLLDHNDNNCRPSQQKPSANQPSMSPSNCWRSTAPDTCRADVPNMMDSSRYVVRAVDVHHHVVGSNNNAASHEHNSSSNNFSDNAKRLDSTTHRSSPRQAPSINAEMEHGTAGRVPTARTIPMSTPMTTTTTTTSTSSGSGNHQINNCKIHHRHQLSEHLPHHPHRPAKKKHSLTSNRDSFSGALHVGELVSPRCQSRDSDVSGGAGEGRCPSNESQYSENGSATHAPAPTPASPPVGLPLAATLAPAAAAALLPPQSAAMAAYFNVAAAAAQQNHLLLTNPLAAAASLVQQATNSHSPSTTRLGNHSPSEALDSSILDFSTKRSRKDSDGNASEEDDTCGDKSENEDYLHNGCATSVDINSPLDLSLGGGRKRQSSSDSEAEEMPLLPSTPKLTRANDFKPITPGSWVPPMNPYLVAVAAAGLSPKNILPLDWNTKQKIAPNEATKALEKMTEMSKLGAATECEALPMRQHATSTSGANNSGGRHSAWQSHWLNKGADAVKDVFKCVWCKKSFPTLASLTTHMKETQHCGVNVPPSPSSGASATSTVTHSGNNPPAPSPQHSRHSSTHSLPNSSSGAAAAMASKSDLNLLIKETMPLPRKLVRGQDIWLGKGAEQTRQILKCMWCGQSFRSLAEMTSHMQETQHYTNIISQEQIISWKSTDDKSSSGGSSSGPATSPALATPPALATATSAGAAAASVPTATAVSAVLTCKVCDEAFCSLKELSSHMVKNSHYKEHMLRSSGESTSMPRGRGRQTREKRKKSLPVRKLLELERAQQDFKCDILGPALKPLRDFAAATKITCEKCGDKIETALFVDHIRQCLGDNVAMAPRNNMKTPYTPATVYGDRQTGPQTAVSRSNGRATADDTISPAFAKGAVKSSNTPSVLNAIEQLIEKSFDTRPRHGNTSFGSSHAANTPLGSNILKRLGIDESVDYTKPLMDPQAMHFLRSYSAFSGRDRSASESSSVSERGSSRLESLTPERISEISRHATPRCTPDRSGIPAETLSEQVKYEKTADVKIKTEDDQLLDLESCTDSPQKISVKKEFNMAAADSLPQQKEAEQDVRLPSHTPRSRAHSPSVSERSITPKSSSSLYDKKLPPCGSSLNALSSMFDSLSNMSAATATLSGETNNNNFSGKKSNSNPLAALQKLCEKNDPPASNTSSNTRSSANTSNHLLAHPPNLQNSGINGAGTANMVAFSWACNDAVMTPDSTIKCSFCDTPFCSKGAYRHHLSKVHFLKGDAAESPSTSSVAKKSPAPITSPRSAASPKSFSKSPAAHHQARSPPALMPTAAVSSAINPYDDSPQSKFLKYTELAKQLSSKNV